jgi:hypothetical protein
MKFYRLVLAVGITCSWITPGLAQQQERVHRSDPIPVETGRFGDPTSTARAYQDYKLGIVKEIRKDQLVLDKTPYGDNQPFKLLPKTKFVHDGEPANIGDLRIGENVYVNVKVDKKTGELTASVVAWGVVGKRMKGQGVK